MRILGIETSCDETAASVVEDGRKILAHVLATSAEMHSKTGGIIPEVAAREQLRSILPVIKEALGEAKMEPREVDALAVTTGPGLIGSLLVGVETAKTLAYAWKKPIAPVNHLVAHIYANWLASDTKEPEFPTVALVVSGGHTDMVLMQNHRKMRWIGGTRDDAAGEAFDKTARVLGLGFPGGPAIAAEAAKFKPQNSKLKIKLPRPMLEEENFDFSFSGLKTAVLREVEKLKAMNQWTNETRAYMAHEIQEAITDVLVAKTLRAVAKLKPKSLLLAGGVAANQRLRQKFEEGIKNQELGVNLFVPVPKLCTDNASYIAAYAFYNFKPIPWQKISASPGLTIMGEE